ncbi:MAG: cytochrome c3 family protein [Acidobacteria bacterium]|nr:cytochrome c3 family protein [Acidobacteriota bacterium]MBI3658612.1 cytochrome c3 family protein [Acidobacteriota bacterium]
MTKAKASVLASFSLLLFGALAVGFARRTARAPEQPIAFNHKSHTIDRKIDCSNCHEYYNQQAAAGIPSVRTCYTCHSRVQTNNSEVKKIFAYYEKKQEIPWIRLYQMPDHVLFTHKRHIKVGLTCRECHGNIGESAVAKREVDHTMGRCMKCHEAKGASIDCLTCHR